MGLAGRKNKQRIGTDPRNLTWSDDSSKFGAKYLQSLGWTSGSGLGASGEGRATNLKIHQKLDLMGIGANRRGVDDTSWKVGREFDGLLARLNRAQNMDASPAIAEELAEDHDDAEKGGDNAAVSEGVKPKKDSEASEKRKRKRSMEPNDEHDDKAAKRRRKQEKKEKKEKKKAEKEAKKQSRSNFEVEEHTTESGVAEPTPASVKVAPRYRAHRARNLASKRLAASSTIGMNEILGIVSSSPSVPSSIPFPTIKTMPPQSPNEVSIGVPLTRIKNHVEDTDEISSMGLGARSIGGGLGFGAPNGNMHSVEADGNDLLRKSGKSVAEYFAEKMRLKTALKQSVTPIEDDATRNKITKGGKKKGKK